MERGLCRPGASRAPGQGLGPRILCSKVALQDLALPVPLTSPVPHAIQNGQPSCGQSRLTHVSVFTDAATSLGCSSLSSSWQMSNIL